MEYSYHKREDIENEQFLPLEVIENEQLPEKTNDLAQYLKGDEYGNSILSLEMEEKNFSNIKNIFNLENLSDEEMLRELTSNMCNKSYREQFNIDLETARRIFVEATDKLLLSGEDITDLIEHYNQLS
ncbi:MAG: hypothetical protein RCO49_06845 [Rickettsia endosymbiont of Argas persicus]